MSLCAACGHNSVFHVDGGCVGHLQSGWTRITLARIYRERPGSCDCKLSRFDDEFYEHTDERGFPLPGHAAYRGDSE